MNLLQAALGPIVDLVSKAVPDATKRLELQAAIEQALVTAQDKAIEATSRTMVADSASEGWLTRNARPGVVVWSLLMISYITISKDAAVLEMLNRIPAQLWELVTLGTGMYIASRGLEKATSTLVKGLRK
jgi:hypothetical protein